MLKGALIGLGNDGPGALLPALARPAGGFEVSAVCEEDAARLAAAGKLLPKAALYSSPEDLFSRSGGLDFAVVGVPAERRFKTVRRALENRLHAACPVPLCFSTSEFETLRETAEKCERSVFPLQPWERSAAWLAVDKAITKGLLGEVDYAEVQSLSDGATPEGGVTAERGWRAFAMLLAMLRRAPYALEARLSPAPEGALRQDAAAAVHVHFTGADGFVRLAAGRHAPLLRLAVHGSKGRLELDGKTLRLDVKDLKPETIELRQDLSAGTERPEWLAAELEEFRKEITGQTPRGAGLRNSRYCAKLLKNAYYSASVRSAAVPL